MPQAGTQYEGNHPDDEWIVEIITALACVNGDEVKTGSICRVPEKMREAKDKGYSYRPQLAAVGPFHRGTRSDLQIIELTKWQYMDYLLMHRTKKGLLAVETCSKAMKGIGAIIRASYGEKIEMAEEELARMMLLDGCFLLELLLRLTGNENQTQFTQKYMLQVLTDLTLLENQIPFVVLTTLSSTLFALLEAAQQQELARLYALSRQDDDKVKLSFENIAKSLLICNDDGADFSKGVYHFLHLIHLCSPDPYEEEERRKAAKQLQRCVRKLQAFGITIRAASQTNDSQGNDQSAGTAASVLTEFVDKFEFEIKFGEGKLTIPTLHIKESTEVKWRNLIAWEQLGLSGIGYKFTSYAYFFKGLVCSVHDLKLLKDKGVIRVDKEVIKDEDLVKMFQSITIGADQMDGRYRAVCDGLNKAKVSGCCVIFKMPEHYLWRFLEWLRRRIVIIWLRKILCIYLGTPWRILGVVSGAIVLALTVLQAVYTVRGR